MTKPTYEELSELCDRLQRQVSRGLRVEAELKAARDALDRENARFRVQQLLSEWAFDVETPAELAQLAIEAFVEAFEVEVAALMQFTDDGERLERIGEFGLPDFPATLPFDNTLLPDDNAHPLPPYHPILELWPDLGLSHVVVCRFCDANRPVLLALVGITPEKERWFQPLSDAELAPFGAMVQQVGTIWMNHHLNAALTERKYRVLFHRSHDGILLTNTDADIVDCNQRVIDMFGYTREELTRMKVFDLTHTPRAESAAKFARIVERGSLRMERTCVRKDGTSFPAEVNASVFEMDDRYMVHGLIRDVTSEKLRQRQLIQSERLAALGQLTAGIAHEINTPVGVIRAAIGNIEEALDSTLERLPRVAQELPEHRLDAFFSLLERARSETPERSSREARRARRRLADILEDAGVTEADRVADTLVDIGIDELDDDLLALLRDHPRATVEVAYDLASLQRNNANIRMAIENASKVVFALRKYVHQDVASELKPADVIEGIEVVLTLYQNKLKHGVEVVKNFDDLPLVPCMIDDLNQVWTNLVHNAIQAMNGEGTLEIVARQEDDEVVIQVIDDGPGIPDDVRDRVFEPFFTTKEAGEGSGLGLDICRRIIDAHNGMLTFDSEPGRTAFTVRLPTTEG